MIYTDEYCACIYSEAKMHNAARAFPAFFSYLSSSLPEYFLNHNLGFWYPKLKQKNERKLFRKKTVVLCDDDDDIDDDDDAEKRGRALLRVILLIFFDDDKKKNEEP